MRSETSRSRRLPTARSLCARTRQGKHLRHDVFHARCLVLCRRIRARSARPRTDDGAHKVQRRERLLPGRGLGRLVGHGVARSARKVHCRERLISRRRSHRRRRHCTACDHRGHKRRALQGRHLGQSWRDVRSTLWLWDVGEWLLFFSQNQSTSTADTQMRTLTGGRCSRGRYRRVNVRSGEGACALGFFTIFEWAASADGTDDRNNLLSRRQLLVVVGHAAAALTSSS